ncbi:MAG: right-handed parallel beta-helix repeat-containing protein [Planctomycetota bacterium]|jgi:hypothetical protein
MISQLIGTTFLTVAAFSALASGGTTWYVDDDNCPGPGSGTPGDPFCSMQMAILFAMDSDEILVAPGTYSGTVNYAGKSIALRSTDGPDVTSIDGGGAVTAVYCAGTGPGTNLEGFTITGGNASAGGGMRILAGSVVTITGCTFSDNTGNIGAAIYVDDGSDLTVDGCTFIHNRSDVGSGINAHGFSSITVTNSLFAENGNESTGGGGGIATFDCDLMVIGCEFTGNTAGGGAGLIAAFGTLTIMDTTFSGNISSFIGGGIDEGNDSTLLVNCVFSNNRASLGGGMFTSTEDITLVNCTFANNISSGLMEDAHSSPILINCVLWGNSPQQLATDPPGDPAAATVYYSAVEGGWSGAGSNNIDTSPLFVDVPSGTWTDPGVFNPATGVSTFTDTGASFAPGELVGGFLVPLTGLATERPIVANTATMISVFTDVAFLGVPGFGYDVNDYRLSAASPCIDAADNTAVPAGVTEDLDGNPRFLEIPETPDTGNGVVPIVDMGAYEALGDGCLAVLSQEVICHGDGSTFTVNVEGLNACTGGTTMVTFAGAGGAVGEDFCTTLVVNTEQGGFCCSTELCVPVPDCSGAAIICGLDGDGEVGVTDVLALLAAWGPCPDCGDCVADLDGDCTVGITDFLILLANWGPCL